MNSDAHILVKVGVGVCLSEIIRFYSSYLLRTARPEHGSVLSSSLSIPCSDTLSRHPPRLIRNCVFFTAAVFPAGSLESIAHGLNSLVAES